MPDLPSAAASSSLARRASGSVSACPMNATSTRRGSTLLLSASAKFRSSALQPMADAAVMSIPSTRIHGADPIFGGRFTLATILELEARKESLAGRYRNCDADPCCAEVRLVASSIEHHDSV